MHHAVSNESSVLFNLRQLMDLEAERLESEAEAARAAEAARRTAEAEAREREAAARARAEREVAAAAERARVEEVLCTQREVAQAEREHAAALLRVRLEAEGSARLELEKLALERERIALEARALQRVRPASAFGRVALVVAGVVVVVLGAAVAHAIVAVPQRESPSVDAHAGEPRVSASLLVDQARELSALRAQIANLSTRAAAVSQNVAGGSAAGAGVEAASLAEPYPSERKKRIAAARASTRRNRQR